MQKKKFASKETLRRVVFALLFCGCMSFYKTCGKDKSEMAQEPGRQPPDTAQSASCSHNCPF